MWPSIIFNMIKTTNLEIVFRNTGTKMKYFEKISNTDSVFNRNCTFSFHLLSRVSDNFKLIVELDMGNTLARNIYSKDELQNNKWTSIVFACSELWLPTLPHQKVFLSCPLSPTVMGKLTRKLIDLCKRAMHVKMIGKGNSLWKEKTTIYIAFSLPRW